jgi:hypothetical protein
VWSPQERAPSKRHETPEGARAEARRLAALYPGREFIVYEARMVSAEEVQPQTVSEGQERTR